MSKIKAGEVTNTLQNASENILGQKKYEKKKEFEGSRNNVAYTYHKLPICRKLFLFMYDCGKKRYKALQSHFKDHGVEVRIHGKTSKGSSNPLTLQPDEKLKIIAFIKSIADRLALPLPGRLPKFKDYSVMKLPYSETKSSIYRMYISALDPEERKPSKRTFRRICNKYVPFITVMKPADDLSNICRGNFQLFLY